VPRDEDAVTRTYTDYFAAFQRLDPREMARFCHTPFLLISPQGIASAADAAEVERGFAGMMDALRARGYGSSEMSELRVKQLSDDTALLNMTGVR
jgi:ketosteroid isomerase-like protein